MIIYLNRSYLQDNKRKTSHHFGLHTTFIQVLPALFLSFSSYQVEWVLNQRVHISHVIANITSSSTTLDDWICCVAYSQMTVNEQKKMLKEKKNNPSVNLALGKSHTQNSISSWSDKPLPNQNMRPSTYI